MERSPLRRPVPICRRRFLQASAAGALLPWLPACSESSDASLRFTDTIAWGRKTLRENMQAAPDAAAVSVALLWQDQIVWQEAFGFASLTESRPATIHTRFNVGSVSKVLAGLCGVMLHEAGLIHLDTPVAEYLPRFRMLGSGYRRITSRHLLSHSSGLPGTNVRGVFTFEPFPAYSADTEAGLAHFHIKHPPGQTAVYCNDGFTLFEQVVLAVTGLTYPEFVRTRILEPLGMHESGFLVQRPPAGDFAHPVLNGRQYPLEIVNAYATGGLSSTPGDMLKLARMFIEGGTLAGQRIVSADGIAEMAREQNPDAPLNPSPEWRWGLGWDAVRQPALDTAGVLGWQKNGGTAFFQTEFFVVPDARIALLVTGNNGYQPLQVAEGIVLRALHESHHIKALPTKVDTTPAAPATPPDPSGLIGLYASGAAPIKVMAGPNGSLVLSQWHGNAWQPMNAADGRYTFRADGWWWAETGEHPSYRFQEMAAEEDGTIVHYQYLIRRIPWGTGYHYTTMPAGQRLQPREPLPATWQARLGTTWQFVNDAPDSVQQVLGDAPVTLGALPELPGYVLYDGAQLLVPINEQRAGMSVRVPVSDGRDLVELEFTTDAAGPLMRIGTAIYRPAVTPA